MPTSVDPQPLLLRMTRITMLFTASNASRETTLPFRRKVCHNLTMRFHASCGARSGPDGCDAVLLVGPSGAGKSDLLLRLVHTDWELVADDLVDIESGVASPPAGLAGVLEVRGLGLFRLPFLRSARLRLVVRLGLPADRLPQPERDDVLDLPAVSIDAGAVSAVARVNLALEAACGRVAQIAGAFAM